MPLTDWPPIVWLMLGIFIGYNFRDAIDWLFEHLLGRDARR